MTATVLAVSPERKSGSDHYASSGYATPSSLFSDDESPDVDEKQDENKSRLHPGICPHCTRIFCKPVTLACGHSLCRACCEQLLASGTGTRHKRRPGIRMGLKSLSWRSENMKCSSPLRRCSPTSSLPWKSPACIVCGEPPKMTPPVPNIVLEAFLSIAALSRIFDQSGEGPSRTILSVEDSLEDSSSRVTIADCNIAIVGGRGVGKSSMKQTQLGNDLMLDELLGRGGEGDRTIVDASLNESGGVHETQTVSVSYMLNLLDSQCSLADKIWQSKGVLVLFSLVDRDSVVDARALLDTIVHYRGKDTPMVLVGTKSDLSMRRVVHYAEGEGLARVFGCPYIEVSARTNFSVNEAFAELARLMEGRGVL